MIAHIVFDWSVMLNVLSPSVGLRMPWTCLIVTFPKQTNREPVTLTWAQAEVKCDSGDSGWILTGGVLAAIAVMAASKVYRHRCWCVMAPFYNRFKGTFLPQNQKDLLSHVLTTTTTTKKSGCSLIHKTLNCQVPGCKMWDYNRNRKTIGKRFLPLLFRSVKWLFT